MTFNESGWAKIDPSGSIPIILHWGRDSLNFLPRPVKVPPVPAPATYHSNNLLMNVVHAEFGTYQHVNFPIAIVNYFHGSVIVMG